MKYSLIIILGMFLSSGLSAQLSISGDAIVCPDNYREYSISSSACGFQVEVLNWVVVGGDIEEIYDHSILVNWNNPELGVAWVDVQYRCWPNIDPEDYEDDWANRKDVDIRNIQTPLFGAASMSIPMGENDFFILSTPDQGPGFNYKWTFPECFLGVDGSNATVVVPDLVSSGTICLTVTNTYCDDSHPECIEITRSCLNTITYTETDELPVFTSVNNFIHTSGNVETTLPDVEFKAGVAINLNPGFTANPDFLAHIAPCGSPKGKGCIGQGSFNLLTADVSTLGKEASSTKVDINDISEVPDLKRRDKIKMGISPNPTLDNFTISLDDFDRSQDYKFEILGLDGQRHLTGQISDSRTHVDISNLSKGFYLVKVNTMSNVAVMRIVKY